MTHNPFPKANGSLTFKPGWRWAWLGFTVYGGPFPNFVEGENTFGLNLRAEAQHKCDAYLPIADFSIPTQADGRVAETIALVIDQALQGKDVYMGCMGGWGRTGLALSLIAKTMGEESPVEFVRKYYSPRAVETSEQYAYVQNFDVSGIQSRLQKQAWSHRIRRIWPF